jgi:hypothetical protein
MVGLPYKLIHISFIAVMIPYKLLLAPFSKYQRAKPWRRVISDIFIRFMAERLTISQYQYLTGNETDTEAYKTVMADSPLTIDDLGDGAKLMWLGPKRTDKVFLYLHGACFVSVDSTILESSWECRWWLRITLFSVALFVLQVCTDGARKEGRRHGLRVPGL